MTEPIVGPRSAPLGEEAVPDPALGGFRIDYSAENPPSKLHWDDECPWNTVEEGAGRCQWCIPRRGGSGEGLIPDAPLEAFLDDTAVKVVNIPIPHTVLEVDRGTPGNNHSGYVGGTKNDEAKPDLSLLPRRPLEEAAIVLMYGMRKYSRDNWRAGFDWNRLIGAALRHIFAFNEGEDMDPETGYCHLSHAICMLMFLSELRHTHPELDNRPTVEVRFEAN